MGFEKLSGKIFIVGPGSKNRREELYLASKSGSITGRCVVDVEKYVLISLYDRSAIVRTTCGIGRESPPLLEFYDHTRKTRLSLTEEADGTPMIRLIDPARNEVQTFR